MSKNQWRMSESLVGTQYADFPGINSTAIDASGFQPTMEGPRLPMNFDAILYTNQSLGRYNIVVVPAKGRGEARSYGMIWDSQQFMH